MTTSILITLLIIVACVWVYNDYQDYAHRSCIMCDEWTTLSVEEGKELWTCHACGYKEGERDI